MSILLLLFLFFPFLIRIPFFCIRTFSCFFHSFHLCSFELFISFDLFMSSILYLIFQFAWLPFTQDSTELHFVLYTLLFCCQIVQLFSFLMIILKISPYQRDKQQPSIVKQSATHQPQDTSGSSMELTFQGKIAVDAYQQTYTKDQVTEQDAGWYSCIGTNLLGDGPPARAQLLVKRKLQQTLFQINWHIRGFNKIWSRQLVWVE